MDCAAVMTELEKRGTAQNRKLAARHGVTGKLAGVADADLAALAKKIKCDHNLALDLWKTGNHDARILATMIADPRQVNAATVDRWARETNNYVLADAVSRIAGQAAAINAGVKTADAKRWSDSPDEWISTLGWNVLAMLGGAGTLPERDALAALDRIERSIATAKNRTRHAMNQALIAIGSGVPAVRERALATADKIGKVEVDHGQTGGKTPDARESIGKGKSRPAKKTASRASPNGARPAAGKKTAAKR